MRVLIADDSMFMRDVLKGIVEKAGHEVVGLAENGEVAVTLYKSLKPDIVTLDITMPVMSGIEALRAIRAYDRSSVVVMISAMGGQDKIVTAIMNGAKDFIVKPFHAEKVIAILEKSK